MLANPFGVTAESLQFVVVAFSIGACETDPSVRSRAALREQRGFTLNEVKDAIRTTPWRSAELGRLECRKDIVYRKEWNGKVYTTKQVRPVFVEEATEIVVVTVYTYYF